MAVGGRRWSWCAAVLSVVLLGSCSAGEPEPTPTVTVTQPAATVTVAGSPSPRATEIITVNALDGQREVRDGYELDDESPGPDIDPDDCDEASGAGMSPNTYACGASLYQADACWRHAAGDLVCIDEPWDRRLFRRPMAGELPETAKPDDPQPLGLQLEDGSRYRQRNGPGGPGLPPEGFINTHYCVSGPCGDDPDAPLSVLLGVDSPSVVQKDGDAWTVLVGELADGEDDASALSRAPEAQRVVRAWFITAE